MINSSTDFISPPSCVVENAHKEALSVLSSDERELLDKNSIEISYRKGEKICRQGSYASHVIFLYEGLVKVYMEGKQKDLILKIVPDEHFIALSSLYEGNQTFLYSVTTYIDTRARLYDVNVFKQLMRTNSRFAYRIISLLNENTAQIYGRFFCLMRKQSNGLVADILLCLSQRIYKRNSFVLALSRNDLGDLTGLAPESVIRILKEFKDEGLIDVKGKQINIIDVKGLERISSYG